jgi:hypothetical protein
VQKIFAQVGYPFDLRLCIKNLPKSHILSTAGIFEDLDYTQPMETHFQHENLLTVEKTGRVDGFLVWLTLETVADEVIDILAHEHSWLPIFLPVFSPSLAVTAGDTIQVACTRTLCENQLNPDYQLTGNVHKQTGENLAFQYTAYNHKRLFKQTPFYAQLFNQAESPEEISSLTETELAELLARELGSN